MPNPVLACVLAPERIDRHNNGWVVSGPAYRHGARVGGTDHDLRPNNESHYIDRGRNQQTYRPALSTIPLRRDQHEPT